MFGFSWSEILIIGTIALVVRPAWRRPYGPLLLAITAVATAFIPVATSSGEALEKRVGNPGEHAELGDQLIWFALPLLVLLAVLVWLDRRTTPPADADSRRSQAGSVKVVAVLALVAALATGVQVYRVGDSGARAAWGDQVSSS